MMATKKSRKMTCHWYPWNTKTRSEVGRGTKTLDAAMKSDPGIHFIRVCSSAHGRDAGRVRMTLFTLRTKRLSRR